MRAHACAVLALLACSCGGRSSDNAGTDSIGEIDGAAFIVRSASATYHRADGPWIGIGLTSQSGTECGPVHEGGWALEMYTFSRGAPLVPGTYPLTTTETTGEFFGGAVLQIYGPACRDVGSSSSTASIGTITFTTLEPRATGSFDVMTRGVHLAGRFDAVICASDPAPSVGVLDACK